MIAVATIRYTDVDSVVRRSHPTLYLMEEAILTFVRGQFKASIGTTAVGPATPLFSTGIIDSFGVLELIAFLEGTFGVEIDPAKSELLEFDTVAKMAALVGRLLKES